MGKRDNSPAISFFSFQDIITSITGIMFLVVLLLVLLFITRSNATPAERQTASELRELKKNLQRLQQQAAANAAANRELRQRVLELQKLDASKLPARKEELVRRLTARQEQFTAERRQEPVLLAELQREQERLKQEEEQQKAAEEKRQKLAAELQKQTAGRRQKEAQLARNRQLMKFKWDRSQPKKPVLALCGAGEISLRDAETGREIFRCAAADHKELVRQFESKCAALSRQQVQPVLLVKPGAFGYAEQLAQQLGALGFDRGLELLPSDDFELAGGGL